MQILFGLVMGIAISSACGCRVFVPLWVMSLGTKAGYMSLPPSFAWLGGNLAFGVLTVATIVEILGYMIPWVDHALDAMALPAASIAGTVATAACLGDTDPALKWTLAIVAGGGTALGTRAALATARAGFTAVSGGLANPVLSAAESVTALFATILAIAAPVLAIGMMLVIVVVMLRLASRFLRRTGRNPPISADP